MGTDGLHGHIGADGSVASRAMCPTTEDASTARFVSQKYLRQTQICDNAGGAAALGRAAKNPMGSPDDTIPTLGNGAHAGHVLACAALPLPVAIAPVRAAV